MTNYLSERGALATRMKASGENRAERSLRNKRIHELAVSGKSQSQIAEAMGLTEGTIAGVLSKDRAKDNERKRVARQQARTAVGAATQSAEPSGAENTSTPCEPADQVAPETVARTTVPIYQIRVGQRHRKDLGDIDALATSIRDLGGVLLQPLVVTPDFDLIAGERRLKAVIQLGWTEVPVRVVEGLMDARLALLAERDENTCRKPFEPSESVAIGKALEELERVEAKERQAQAGPRKVDTPHG